MDLIDLIPKFEKKLDGHMITFSEEEQEFIEAEYFRTQKRYLPKSCGNCITGFKVLLNIARIQKKEIKNQEEE